MKKENHAMPAVELARSLARSRALPQASQAISKLHDDYLARSGISLIQLLSTLRKGTSLTIDAKDLSTLLHSMNPKLKLLECSSSQIVIQLAPNLNLPHLPLHYCFKGGAARFALLKSLFPERGIRRPRDIDLVCFVRSNSAYDSVLKETLLGEDGLHGTGVEYPDSQSEYFGSRDLCINQIYVQRQKAVISQSCLEDILAANLRITPHALSQPIEQRARTCLKLLRVVAELSLQGFDCKASIPEDLKASHIHEWHMKLECKRALERGRRVAEAFFRSLQAHELVNTSILHFGDLLATQKTRIKAHSSTSSQKPSLFI